MHGRPLGQTRIPIVNGRIDVESLRRRIVRNYLAAFRQSTWRSVAIATGVLPSRNDSTDLLRTGRQRSSFNPVGNCRRLHTGTAADDLERCLAALCAVDYPGLDVVVIDNARRRRLRRAVVRRRLPSVRCVRDRVRGSATIRARNRAILEMLRGDILAFHRRWTFRSSNR